MNNKQLASELIAYVWARTNMYMEQFDLAEELIERDKICPTKAAPDGYRRVGWESSLFCVLVGLTGYNPPRSLPLAACLESTNLGRYLAKMFHHCSRSWCMVVIAKSGF